MKWGYINTRQTRNLICPLLQVPIYQSNTITIFQPIYSSVLAMAPDIPQTVKQWNVTSHDGTAGFDALAFSEQQVPRLGDSEVLVKSQSSHG